MPTVVLIRHGRSTANAEGVLAGRTEGVELDPTGETQAAGVAERVAGVEFAAVVSSPMLRCRRTAELICPGRPVQTEERLTECDYGTWSGTTLKALAEEPLWETVQRTPSRARFPDGESLTEMSTRAVAAIRDWDARVEQEHGSDAVWLAVSHGDVIKAVLADAFGMHLDLFQRIVVDPASASIVRYTANGPMVLGTNISGREFVSLMPTAEAGSGDEAVVGGRDA